MTTEPPPPRISTDWSDTAHLGPLREQAIINARARQVAERIRSEQLEAVRQAAAQRQRDHDWTPVMWELLEICQRHHVTFIAHYDGEDDDEPTVSIQAHSGECTAHNIEATPDGVEWWQGNIHHEVTGQLSLTERPPPPPIR